MITPILITLNYYEQHNRSWDSYMDNKLLVKGAKSLSAARVFSDTLLAEEYQSYIIAKEAMTYYLDGSL